MTVNKKIKILCFTDLNAGRDAEMVLPVRYFAEKFLNCEFIHAISFDIYRIYQEKPDIVMTPNSRGSTLYWKIARAAFEQNIPLFSLESEGNFKTDGSFNYWGYNCDKKFYQQYVCCWSERTQKFLIDLVPESKDKIVLTGGVGFDRFKIYKYADRIEFLKKYGLENYRKIIGYGAWTFNKVNFLRGRMDIFNSLGNNESSIAWVNEQRKLINAILEDVVANNKDILFVFKRHPQDNPTEKIMVPVNEMQNLNSYENVLFFNDEESLQDLINVSDIWTCFESTTAIEAWLMGKQTIFINPEPEFPRADIYKGSAIANNSSRLQKMLDEFYSIGRITEFYSEEKKHLRAEIIKNTIGFDDGLNHIRAAYFLEKTIEKLERFSKPAYRLSLKEFLYHQFTILGGLFYVNFIYRYLYKLKKHMWVFENYKMIGIEKLYKKYVPFFDEYYYKNGIENGNLSNILHAKLISYTGGEE